MARLTLLKKGQKSPKWKPWYKHPVKFWKLTTLFFALTSIILPIITHIWL